MSRKRKSSRRSNKSSKWDKRKTAACLSNGGKKMREKNRNRLNLVLVSSFAGLLCWPAASSAQSQPRNTEWPSYGADLAGTRYRPLDQINAANFSDLEIAWRIKTDNFGDRTESAPVVAKDTVIIGAAFREGMTPRSMRNNKGYVRGFDVRTGKRLWIFHTIPKKGEFGYDTWEKGSAEYTGNTGVWTQITVDEQLGLVYLPVESPTSDFYGGHPPGKHFVCPNPVCRALYNPGRQTDFQIVP